MRINHTVHKTTTPNSQDWDAYILPDGVWLAIPFLPPSLNVWSRWHWAKRKRYLDNLGDNLAWLARAHNLPRFEQATVQVTYLFPDRRHRDKDNYNGKFILDALRRAGILTDDRAELISLPEPEFLVDRHRPRTEVWVTRDEELGGEYTAPVHDGPETGKEISPLPNSITRASSASLPTSVHQWGGKL